MKREPVEGHFERAQVPACLSACSDPACERACTYPFDCAENDTRVMDITPSWRKPARAGRQRCGRGIRGPELAMAARLRGLCSGRGAAATPVEAC